MVLFDFKSEGHFIASSDRLTLKIYELTKPTIHPSSIRKTHWREIADICAPDDDGSYVDHEDEGDDGNDDAQVGEESSYDGLMFFDGHGKIEGWEALTKLAQHLTRLQLMVSPQGQCYQNVMELGEHRDLGIHYLRLNDLFNWLNHGVSMASISTWRRLVLKYTIPRREGKRPTTGGMSKETHEEELKNKVKEKDHDQLKTLMEEVENLRRANNEHEARAGKGKIMVDVDEWRELKKFEAEMREKEATKKDEEMKRRLENEKRDKEVSQKDAELQKLREEKEAMMKANTAETQNLKDQLSHLHELEQRRKQPWVLQTGLNATRLSSIEQRRQPVPPDTFNNAINSYHYVYEPVTTTALWPFPSVEWDKVDEDAKDWPPPPKIGVDCHPGQFDKNNWWFVKTVHPDGGLAMVAYYDGDQIVTSKYTVRISFPRNSRLRSTTPFFMLVVDFSYRMAFMYRD